MHTGFIVKVSCSSSSLHNMINHKSVSAAEFRCGVDVYGLAD